MAMEGGGLDYEEKDTEIVQDEGGEAVLVCGHFQREQVVHVVVFRRAAAPELGCWRGLAGGGCLDTSFALLLLWCLVLVRSLGGFGGVRGLCLRCGLALVTGRCLFY